MLFRSAPGAGFAETAEYNRVFAAGQTPPPWWEQVLYRWYDATLYAANLANITTVAEEVALGHSSIRGAHSSRVLVMASRQNALPQGAAQPQQSSFLIARRSKFVSAGRRDQHPGRVCSPEHSAPRLTTKCVAHPAAA